MTSNYNVLYTGNGFISKKWKEGDIITAEHFNYLNARKFFKFIDCKIISLSYQYGIGSIMVDYSQWNNETEYPNRVKKANEWQTKYLKGLQE